MSLPKNYTHKDREDHWAARWEADGIYRWQPAPRDQTFIVDTPPPTVSGSLHIGHVFSYTQTDIIVRFHRMRGKKICYPMGWDDNGLPTERRVQNVFGIRCNPNLPYDPNLKLEKGADGMKEVSRQNFIEACEALTIEDEKVFEALWRRLGLSVDWTLTYSTIDGHCRATSQASFLDLVKKGHVAQHVAPTMWDISFQTAVAQAEVEDREKEGAFRHIAFQIKGGTGNFREILIATTRPELLPACIALVAHPDDKTYQPFFGKTAISPLFGVPVPILPSTHADPEKGTGILMVCTFGDSADVEWWKQSGLGVRLVLNETGRMRPIHFGTAEFPSENPDSANIFYEQLKGLPVTKARAKITELLKESMTRDSAGELRSALRGEPSSTMQMVKYYEKGDQPLEFLSTRQWFIKILDHQQDLLTQGEKIQWVPEHMKIRYRHWVEGLNQDWCISRQRFFGVPFPVWYPLNAQGEVQYDRPIMADSGHLPVDPLAHPAPGYSESERNQPNGFAGDPDVMDTWATSSLTPQIISKWSTDPERHRQLFPMDLRPQAHEIIRTWAFYTITKAWMHDRQIPWKTVAISGWILDPDRKKMSKSKGNVITPGHLLDQYSADAIRYWAGKARLGADTAYDETVFKIGGKLTTKLFNAAKFVLTQLENTPKPAIADIQTPLDCAWVHKMRILIDTATRRMTEYEYAAALEETESIFWMFCDHTVELIKSRSYQLADQPEGKSALATLEWTLSVFLRLFAPFLPFITEEIWTAHFTAQAPSIHIAPWPTASEIETIRKPEDSELVPLAIDILSHIRAAKTEGQKSLKWPVRQLEITGPNGTCNRWESIKSDVCAAGKVETVTLTESTTEKVQVKVILSAEPPHPN